MLSFATHLVSMGPFIKYVGRCRKSDKTLDIISITVTTFNIASHMFIKGTQAQ